MISFYAPPSGYDDLTADAARTPITAAAAELLVPGVGAMIARPPAPRSAAALAAACRPRCDQPTRTAAMQTFVGDHLQSPTLDDLFAAMITDKLPDDALGRVARAVATWGTSRPYLAVSTLAAITAQHWRIIRAHLIVHGVTDPMLLTSLHALLDVTEQLVLESIQESTAAATKREREHFLDQLYAPDLTPAAINGPGYTPEPAGFSDAEQEESFDVFARSLGAGG